MKRHVYQAIVFVHAYGLLGSGSGNNCYFFISPKMAYEMDKLFSFRHVFILTAFFPLFFLFCFLLDSVFSFVCLSNGVEFG